MMGISIGTVQPDRHHAQAALCDRLTAHRGEQMHG